MTCGSSVALVTGTDRGILVGMSRSTFVLMDLIEGRRVCPESLRIATEIHVTSAAPKAKPHNLEHALKLLLMVLNRPVCLEEIKNQGNRLRAELEVKLIPTQTEAIQAHASEKTIEAVGEDLNTIKNRPGDQSPILRNESMCTPTGFLWFV